MSEVFSRIRRSSISNTSLAPSLPLDSSTLATSAACGHYSRVFGRGGRESRAGGP